MTSTPPTVLLAEDDESDVFFLQRAFKEAGVNHLLQVVPDGQSAIDYLTAARLRGEERQPALVLLDLKMPRRTGLQVLQWIREQPVLRTLPVFLLSSSENRTDIESAYEAGANAYLVKPPSLAERLDLARFIRDWFRLVQKPVAAAESYRAAQALRTAPPEQPLPSDRPGDG